jgi:hypothetical protein
MSNMQTDRPGTLLLMQIYSKSRAVMQVGQRATIQMGFGFAVASNRLWAKFARNLLRAAKNRIFCTSAAARKNQQRLVCLPLAQAGYLNKSHDSGHLR